MSNPLHASYYADNATQVTTAIVENETIARDTMRVRFRAPEIAARVAPGQFLMARLAEFQDPLIGRALALYDVIDDPAGDLVDLVYLVKGKFTSRLAEMTPGAELTVWGPLGNGFSTAECEHLVMVAGGIGYTPFLAVAQERLGRRQFAGRAAPTASQITFCYGARSADLHAGVDQFQQAGVDVRLATDDGTAGHHGLVTDLLREVLADEPVGRQTRILCCGPEPMMEAVSDVADQFSVPCEVSLETPMACGVGICFTCVAKVKEDDGNWDYKRTCVEGPVFCSEKIVW